MQVASLVTREGVDTPQAVRAGLSGMLQLQAEERNGDQPPIVLRLQTGRKLTLH